MCKFMLLESGNWNFGGVKLEFRAPSSNVGVARLAGAVMWATDQPISCRWANDHVNKMQIKNARRPLLHASVEGLSRNVKLPTYWFQH